MKSIYSTQSNTIIGLLALTVAATTLVGKEGLVCVLGADGLTPVAAKGDLANYLILEGAAPGGLATVCPLHPGENVRIRAQGTGSKGDVLVLAVGGDVGKVSTFAAQTGVCFSVGIAEEDFVDEQLVLVRPLPRYLTGVATAFAGAAPAATAATSTTPFGFAEAQANALLLTVNNIRAALIDKGIMAANA